MWIQAVRQVETLQYDAVLDKWKGAAMNLSSLSDVNSTMLSPSGKFLYYDGAQWDVKSIKVQELADVEAGMGAGKVMVGRSDGTKFEFADYTLDGLTNVNSTGKGVGSVLVWKGDALGWKVDTNKISDINELDGFNIANPSNKYMYHDGTEVDCKRVKYIDNDERFNGYEHCE